MGLSLSFEVAGVLEKVAREKTVIFVAIPCLSIKVARANPPWSLLTALYLPSSLISTSDLASVVGILAYSWDGRVI